LRTNYDLIYAKQTQFVEAKMNVSSILTKYYENVPLRRRGENKPNQTQSPKSQNEIKLLFNKGL
jgi:hypothetical protein